MCPPSRPFSACSRSVPSSAHKGLIGTSLFTTECISEKSKGHGTPSLPTELVDIVVDFAIELARCQPEKQGMTLCKLLHTSRALRKKIARLFQPITLYECTQDVGDGTLLIPQPLATYVWELVNFHFLDFSLRDGKEPETCECDIAIASSTGQRFRYLTCSVGISTGGFAVPSHRWVLEEERDAVYDIANSGEDIEAFDVCFLLERTMAFEELQNVRLANIYQRALAASPLGSEPSTKLEIVVTILLRIEPQHIGVEKRWRFVNASY